MSNNLAPVFDSKDYFYLTDYLHIIFEVRGWTLKKMEIVSENPHYVAKKYVSREIGTVIFEFNLNNTLKKDCIVLIDFKLYLDGPNPKIDNLLSTIWFLVYQGLLPPDNFFYNGSTFEIRAPKDFVAFLDLYDKAARSLGKIPLFQIQEKTK